MTWANIPQTEKQAIVQAYNGGSLNWAALYEQYPELPKQATVQRYIRRYRQMLEEMQPHDQVESGKPPDSFAIPTYPESPSPLREEWLEIDCSNAIVIADVELPDYDPIVMQLATAMGMQYGIKTLIIGGDFQAFDRLKKFDDVFGDEASIDLVEDMKLAREVLQRAGEWFENKYAVMGNHDELYSIAINKLYRELVDSFGRMPQLNYDVLNADVEVKPYRYMYLNPVQRQRIMIVHPKNYSKDQLKVPRNLFDIEPERCSIMSTHTHHCAIGHPLPGAPYQIAEIGCVRDPRRTAYKMRSKTFHPQWVQGFASVRAGLVSIHPKETTDWKRELDIKLYNQIFNSTLY